MSRILINTFFIFLLMISCKIDQKRQNNNSVTQKYSTINSDELQQNETEEIMSNKPVIITKIDTNKNSFPSISVDDYPITNVMFKSAKYLEEPILQFDGLWFSSGNQTLAIALYTDYYRYAIFHFRNDFVPIDLIDEMELHKPLPITEIADLDLKIDLFQSVFPNINEIDSSYFISNKGFQLGDLKIKAINKYGQPDSTIYDNEVEILYWKFIGDIFYDGKQNLNGKLLAKNSFGHQVKMYFRNEKLIGVFLHNDIP